MWWVYVVIGVVFLLFLILDLINYFSKKRKIVKMQASCYYKKFFKLSVNRISCNRNVIYYSRKPMHIRFDPSNFDIYKAQLVEVPVYSTDSKRTKKYLNTNFTIYLILMILGLVLFLVSLTFIILNSFFPDMLSFFDGNEVLETIKTIVTSYYTCTGCFLFALLFLIFMITNRSYKKFFVYYIPTYLNFINRSLYFEATKPIRINLD